MNLATLGFFAPVYLRFPGILRFRLTFRLLDVVACNNLTTHVRVFFRALVPSSDRQDCLEVGIQLLQIRETDKPSCWWWKIQIRCQLSERTSEGDENATRRTPALSNMGSLKILFCFTLTVYCKFISCHARAFSNDGETAICFNRKQG